MERAFMAIEKILNLIERLLKTPVLSFVLVLLFSITGILSFSPFGLREKLELDVFHNKHKDFISLLFLFSIICFLYLFCLRIYRAWRKHKNKRLLLHQLQNLSPYEQGILAFLSVSSSGAEWLPFGDENVLSLINKGMLTLQIKNVMSRPEKDFQPCVLCALHPLVRHEVDRIVRAENK